MHGTGTRAAIGCTRDDRAFFECCRGSHSDVADTQSPDSIGLPWDEIYPLIRRGIKQFLGDEAICSGDCRGAFVNASSYSFNTALLYLGLEWSGISTRYPDFTSLLQLDECACPRGKAAAASPYHAFVATPRRHACTLRRALRAGAWRARCC